MALVTTTSTAPATAEVVDIPGPTSGCFDSVAAGVGLFEGAVTPAGGVTLDVPGPVEQVIVEWIGEFVDAPTDFALGVEITKPDASVTTTDLPGTFSASDSHKIDGSAPFSFAYWEDATALFDGGAGTYSVDFTPPPDLLPGQNHWWGATVTVVYDTSPCGAFNDFFWKIGADYYFGGSVTQSPTTEIIVYDLGQPLQADQVATVRFSHGGADSAATGCRVSTLWSAAGGGTPPVSGVDVLVDEDGNVVTPGSVDIVVDPFTPTNQPCPPVVFNAPAVGVDGGSVGPEYALIDVDILLPAGTSWVAFQLESPRDNDGLPGLPESGSWSGSGLLAVTSVGDPSIRLEKTVLDGSGAPCPGIEGTDELVVTDENGPVTYCFRVINDGTTALFPVTLDDATLGIDESDLELVSGDDTVPLLIGQELVYRYNSTAAVPLTNVATVVGIPSDEDGDPIDYLDPVEDTNDAEVDLLPPPTTAPPTTATPTTAPPTTAPPTTATPTTAPPDTTTTTIRTSVLPAGPTTTIAIIGPGTPELPATGGSNSMPAMLGGAAAALIAGVGIVLASRRRRPVG
ncbi:MAG: LPXTG cell wall anchor domain-containing protein [Actinomycetota bacterium]